MRPTNVFHRDKCYVKFVYNCRHFVHKRISALINGEAREFPASDEDPATRKCRSQKHDVSSLPPSSPPLSYADYCPIYRPSLPRLSVRRIVSLPLSLSALARWSTKLARDPRRASLCRPPPAWSARCLGARAVLSRQSRARNAISMGFFWGLVSKPPLYRREQERERERPFPRLRRPSPCPVAWIQARSVVHRVGTSSRRRRRRQRRWRRR